MHYSKEMVLCILTGGLAVFALIGTSIFHNYQRGQRAQKRQAMVYHTQNTIPANLLAQQRLQYRTHRQLHNMQQKLGSLQKVVTNNRHITYHLAKNAQFYDSLLDHERTSNNENNLAPYTSHNQDFNYMAIRTYYGTKQTLVAIRVYDLHNTYTPYLTKPHFYRAQPADDDDFSISGYVPIQDLRRVKAIRHSQKLPNIPYYLNSFDGYHSSDIKMTSMRVWNAVPGSKPNVTGGDVSHLLYQQLYATAEATNNQGRTYLHLRNAKESVGWIRKSFQLTQGKFISPAQRLLHAKKTDVVRLQTQPVSTQHGYHYAQRVYNLYNSHHDWIRSLSMSYLFYPTVMNIHHGKVVAVKFYDHHYRLVKQVTNASGLTKYIEQNPKPGTLNHRNGNGRWVTFNTQSHGRRYLYELDDGNPDSESTYGTIKVTTHGQAFMRSTETGPDD